MDVGPLFEMVHWLMLYSDRFLVTFQWIKSAIPKFLQGSLQSNHSCSSHL